MNSKSEDEDYWQASDSKAFSFDEEEVIVIFMSNMLDKLVIIVL